MRTIVKYFFISVLAVIPVLLIFSGLSEKPGHNQIMTGKDRQITSQHGIYGEKSGSQPSHIISTVEEYEALSSFGRLPEIYFGLSIDGELKADEYGNLIISEEVKMLFDFFLSARQTEGLGLCSDRVREYIDLTLNGIAAEKAHKIFSLYITYLEETADLENGLTDEMDLTTPGIAVSSLKKALNNRIKLSQNIFGEEAANQLFKTSHKTSLYIINKIEILQNPTFSNAEKEIFIEEESNLLSPMQKNREEKAQQEKSFEMAISNLQEKGEHEEIFNLRKEKYGESAARSLSLLDTKNKELENRIEQFLSKKRSLLNGTEPDSPEIQKQINELRKNSFEEWELSALRKAEVSIDRQS